MGLELNRVHHFERESGGSAVRLVRTTPYMRFCQSGEFIIFLQGGNLYYENGESVKGVPEWVKEAAKTCGQTALSECGWDKLLANEKPKMVAASPQAAPKENGQSLTNTVGKKPTPKRTQFRRP